jgi:hypothetical protein
MTRTHTFKAQPNHPWDKAAATVLTRPSPRQPSGETLDPGVNFFVLALEALGATTSYSCEGHPSGFYITFHAPYELALKLRQVGFFGVEIEGDGYWSLRKYGSERQPEYGEAEKIQTLRWAAEAWLKAFGDQLAALR